MTKEHRKILHAFLAAFDLSDETKSIEYDIRCAFESAIVPHLNCKSNKDRSQREKKAK
jgi:hypothetical protein